MTHEGRMARGEEKLAKGISDIETKYFLDNKQPEEPEKPNVIHEEPKEPEAPKKETKKKETADGKSD